eukprot:9957070-Prorocentrum_lima.AAC.1
MKELRQVFLLTEEVSPFRHCGKDVVQAEDSNITISMATHAKGIEAIGLTTQRAKQLNSMLADDEFA